MHRFFIPPEWISGERVTIVGDLPHQLQRVLRLKPGDSIIILDDSGWEYQVRLINVAGDRAEGVLYSRKTSPGEPRVHIALYQGLLKGDKFEFVLQKGTELGIGEFIPVVCERSIGFRSGGVMARGPSAMTKGGDGVGAEKIKRWQKIVREAAEQSGRGRLPPLRSALFFKEACEVEDGYSLLPWEGESILGLRAALRDWHIEGLQVRGESVKINLFIGPEGGFSQGEVDYARSRGITPVSLGRRILRAETAAVVAASAILYEIGELGE